MGLPQSRPQDPSDDKRVRDSRGTVSEGQREWEQAGGASGRDAGVKGEGAEGPSGRRLRPMQGPERRFPPWKIPHVRQERAGTSVVGGEQPEKCGLCACLGGAPRVAEAGTVGQLHSHSRRSTGHTRVAATQGF